jgi:outer membrane protein OmpA-like peptidoglycan-associated protein
MGKKKLWLVAIVIMIILMAIGVISSTHFNSKTTNANIVSPKESKADNNKLQGFEGKELASSIHNNDSTVDIAKKPSSGNLDKNKASENLSQNTIDASSNLKNDSPQENINALKTSQDQEVNRLAGFDTSNDNLQAQNIKSGNSTTSANQNNLKSGTDKISNQENITMSSPTQAGEVGKDQTIKNKESLQIKNQKQKNKNLIVYFGFDQDTLSDIEKEKITGWLTLLHGGQNLLIKGYTDSIGTKDYNESLSLKRAMNTSKLVHSSKQNFTVKQCIGLGESNPAFDNSTPEGRSKNRRVEISIE